MTDVYTELCNKNDDLARVLRKWEPIARKIAHKIARVTGISVEDALQDVVTCMWEAHRTHGKHQVRYDGTIWDVVVDGPKYELTHAKRGRLELPRWKAEPIDKTMSVETFVFMRLCQYKSTLFDRHHALHNGYVSTGTVTVRGRERKTYVRVVFECPLGKVEKSSVYTQEDHLIFNESIALAHRKLARDPAAQLMLEMYVHHNAAPHPKIESDLTYFASVLDISTRDALRSRIRMIDALPEEVRALMGNKKCDA